MKTNLEQVFETILKDKKALQLIKDAASRINNYELLTEIREIESINFPETEEQKVAKREAEEMNLAFRMADLNVPLPESWLIKQVVKAHMKRKGKLSINETSTLVAKMHQIFD